MRFLKEFIEAVLATIGVVFYYCLCFIAVGLIVVIALIAGWVVHVSWSAATLTDEEPANLGQILFSVIGIFFVPVGVVHGLYLIATEE